MCYVSAETASFDCAATAVPADNRNAVRRAFYTCLQTAVSTPVPGAFKRPAVSLEVPGKADEEELDESVGRNSPFRRFLWLLGYHSSEAVTIRGATGLYEAVCKQCDADGLHDKVELQPSFYSRWCAVRAGTQVSPFAIACARAAHSWQEHMCPGACRCLLALHVWLLLARLRSEGEQTRALRQELYDLFQEDVEVRVRQLISLRISSTLEELERDFYGNALALDKVRQCFSLHRGICLVHWLQAWCLCKM
jgi:Ubiquinol-cytochrome C chaperone